MKIKQFTFNLLRENCYVIYDEDTKDCAIIDPGNYYPEEGTALVDFIAANGLVPGKVLLTHCHLDHLFGLRFLRETFPAIQICAQQAEQYFIDNVETEGNMFGLKMETPPSISHYLFDGEHLKIGNIDVTVLSTPGHSPGGACFYCEQEQVLFSGDALFCGGIGRTDLHGGNYQQLVDAIRTKLLTLPEETVVHCGHGAPTTIGEEKHSNPYI